MLTGLIVITLVTFAGLFLLFRRDRKYLRKSLKDVVTEEMKMKLNLRHKDARFDSDFQRKRNVSSKSKEILRQMNDL